MPIYRLSIRFLDRVSSRIRRSPYFANVSPAVRALHCALFRKADLLHDGEIVPEQIFFILDAILPMSQCRGPHDCWRRAAKIRTARDDLKIVDGNRRYWRVNGRGDVLKCSGE